MVFRGALVRVGRRPVVHLDGAVVLGVDSIDGLRLSSGGCGLLGEEKIFLGGRERSLYRIELGSGEEGDGKVTFGNEDGLVFTEAVVKMVGRWELGM